MGLSDGERLEKFYWMAREWRKRLVKLQSLVEKDKRKTVSKWVRELDLLLGDVILRANTTSAYWIIGSNDSAFQTWFSEPSTEREGEPYPEHSARKLQSETSLADFGEGISRYPYTEDQEVVRLAHFWHQWACVDAVLYPVRRYNDKLFSKAFHQRLQVLLGEMAARRFEICANYYGEPVEKEAMLLGKWQEFSARLDEAASAEWQHPKDAKPKRFDKNGLYKDIVSLSAWQVREAQKTRREAKYKRDDEYRRSEREKESKKTPKLDAMKGAGARPRAALDFIIENGWDKAEVEAAVKELEFAYSTFTNAKPKNKPSKKAQAAYHAELEKLLKG